MNGFEDPKASTEYMPRANVHVVAGTTPMSAKAGGERDVRTCALLPLREILVDRHSAIST
jgi:hypothetical protein